MTFEGDGTFRLEGAGAEIAGPAHTAVELDNDGTIEGAGKIGGDDRHFVLVNERSGVIDASGSRRSSSTTTAPEARNSQPSNAVINTGMIEATGHGGLTIDNTTISNATDAAHDTGVVVLQARTSLSITRPS